MTDQATKLITPDPAVVTHLDELQAKCLILYDLFTAYGNFEYLDNIEKAVASSLPGPPYGPHTKDDGEATFLAFDPNSPLKNQDAANRIKEMRPRMRPGIDWQPEHVKAVHKVMCTGKAGQFTLGEKIPYGSLAFFLHYCHDIIEVPVENEALIEKHLHAVNLPYSIFDLIDFGQEGNIPLAFQFLVHHKVLLEAIQRASWRLVESIAREHGGVLKQKLFDNLKRHLSITSDR
ncbi:unnamed protein product [Fusarium venenatum]|uniref:Uncharacterized protein n=1 Tax=Fusarium venenatum TaxID=56646 RepID=A0A2L2TLH9_9HYPO|nr:uncharacterized protein FVRRES_01919 [Fusarium venenatum]CEI65407.1 unnamed protein product [Fusarium venenatum]